MWDLCSLTRDQPLPPVSAVRSLHHWTTREVPVFVFYALLTALFPPPIRGKILKTILKWTISGILVIHRAVLLLHLPNSRTPSSSQEEPVSLLLCRVPATPALSSWVCLFWVFHINRIIQYVTFCVWLFDIA